MKEHTVPISALLAPTAWQVVPWGWVAPLRRNARAAAEVGEVGEVRGGWGGWGGWGGTEGDTQTGAWQIAKQQGASQAVIQYYEYWHNVIY